MIPGYRPLVAGAPVVEIDFAAEKAASAARRAARKAAELETVRAAVERADEWGYQLSAGIRVGNGIGLLGLGKGKARCHCGGIRHSRAKECGDCKQKRPCAKCGERLGPDAATGDKHVDCRKSYPKGVKRRRATA